MDDSYDVVVVGGGAAGLSGAVALARSRRSVLVVDAGEPRNAVAGHVHNFFSRDGSPPADLYASGRAEVRSYGGHVVDARVRRLRRNGDRFLVELGDASVTARRLLIATGLSDELPEVPGLAERWGIDVLHCPYCHGWEVRDRRIGVLATGPAAVHQSLLFRQLSPHVTLMRHTGPEVSEEQAEQLTALGVDVVEDKVVEVVASAAAGLTGVRLADGTMVDLDALVVAPRFTARAEELAELGLEPVEVSMGPVAIGSRIETDPTGATAVPGVWAAGNVADVQAQVVSSAAAGLVAGAAINADLIAEDARTAVAEHRYQQAHGERAWDDRYRSRTRTWSGNPNPVLVAEVADLSPGTAFDAGSGEGADALWLAARGWRVTGAEFSRAALERAAAEADRLGLTVDWRHLDLTRESPSGRYDLVSAFFLHLPLDRRQRLFAALAAAVAPGGTLLIVGHDPSDMQTTMPRPGLDEMGWATDEVASHLGDGWTVEVAETRPRPAVDPEGREITIADAVFRARRRVD